MKHSMINLLLVGALVTGALALGLMPATAQDGAHGYTMYELNMRSGPDFTHAVITILAANTGMIFEARSADTAWLLGTTLDGQHRGWVASLYFSYEDGFWAANLPVSEEIIAAPPSPPPAAVESAGPAAPAEDSSAAPTPSNGPIDPMDAVPTIGPRVREIYQHGQSLGNHPNRFTRTGDCNSNSTLFLSHAIGNGQYNLGPYGYLQSTINYFGAGNSYWEVDIASQDGITIRGAIDADFANRDYCGPGESPLACDFRRLQPSVLFIMQTMGDAMFISDELYEQSLRQVVSYAIDNGVIPVLITFPTLSRSGELNWIMRTVGASYGVPVVDFSAAAGGLPNYGLQGGNDVIHLSGNDFINFNGEQNMYGFTLLNFVTLHTLNRIVAAVQ